MRIACYGVSAIAFCASTGVFAATTNATMADPAVQPSAQAVAGEAATTTGAAGEYGDIVVTAQKRADRLRDVPLSINAASGDQLKAAGVTSTADLEKIVPGFVQQQSAFGNPVFFIRGVGFNDTTLGVAPAVSVYLDQQPLSFSPMARGAILDLERVEVLKGPQGTLFGQNSTGGAINYIAAKPTDVLAAGLDVTVGRFGQADAEGFVSGPLSDTVSARAAVRSENRGDWQKGYTTDQELGAKDFLNGRLSLQWEPGTNLRARITANAWRDRSDAQQPQFIRYEPLAPGNNPVDPDVVAFPVTPRDARLAAWDDSFDYANDNWLYQFTGDVGIDLTETLTLTALTSYAKYRQDVTVNYSATSFPVGLSIDRGDIETFSQELRLSGNAGSRISWMAGLNYKWDHVVENFVVDPLRTSGAAIVGVPFTTFRADNDQTIRNRSVFGSIDVELSDQLTLQGSARYTKENRDFVGCVGDTGDGELAAAVNALTGYVGVPSNIAPGGCTMLTAAFEALPIIENSLDEDNFSWRASLNWKPAASTLLYANVTKGYKAGNFPTIAGILAAQLDPISQESVLAYELGAKVSPARKIDVTGAVFYYDYSDKQLLGNKHDPVFGPLFGLIPIPESHIKGAELSLNAGPFGGLTVSANVTHVLSKVTSEPIPIGGTPLVGPFDDLGATFIGQSFPLTPKWQGAASVDYRFDMSPALSAFVGTSVTARSGTYGQLISANANPQISALQDLLKIEGYILVDARAGVATRDGHWQLEVWGRNVFDKYYTNGNTRNGDFVTAFAGMPATYGLTVKYRL